MAPPKKARGAKKATAKKATTKRSTAKKAAPTKKTTARKTTAKKSSVKKVKGTIRYFDPTTGRGEIETDAIVKNIKLDVATAKILNKGYVRLDAGRPVTVSVEDDVATDLMAE